MGIIISIVGLLIALFIDYLIAKEFCKVAEMKGFGNSKDLLHSKYFWLTFLLGAVGYLLVIALPDRRAAQSSKTGGFELPEI